jgi:hypothetical protein
MQKPTGAYVLKGAAGFLSPICYRFITDKSRVVQANE